MGTMQTECRFTQNRRISFLWLFAVLLLAPVGLHAQSNEQFETIRVDSNLVDLKVSVVSLTRQLQPTVLGQKDFLVLEDGAVQEISFFAAADTPFDLILLLDLSGSTSDKISLVRKSAKRFVDATRPVDRVGIVTFTDVPAVVSQLTSNRLELKQAIDDIEKPLGGTNFYDALRFVLEDLLKRGNGTRRSAVVVMTDGVDNALPDVNGDGSRTSFNELLALVQKTDTLVFPVYLDTEKETIKKRRSSALSYVIARAQLEQLAQACGTLIYRAAKLKDLDQVYARVIKDLSTIYSIGYKPTNSLKDGKWRSVVVKLNERPELTARAKSGYFAAIETDAMKD